MSKYIVETETGSLYFIDTAEKRWSKYVSYPQESIERLAVGYWDGTYENLPVVSEWEDRELPEVGKNMYIKGDGDTNWYVTTPIKSVEESNG